MQIDMKCMLCCTNSFFFMFYHSKSMGVLLNGYVKFINYCLVIK